MRCDIADGLQSCYHANTKIDEPDLTDIRLPNTDRPYVQFIAAGREHLGEIDRKYIRALYEQHGAILLRGFSGDLEDFGRFCADFCPVTVQNESRNRAALGTEHNIQSVNLGAKAFPLHPELSREPWKPDTAFFYCIDPSHSGGMTTLCDGTVIVKNLPKALVNTMAARRIKYLAPAGNEVLKYWLGEAEPSAELLANPPARCPYQFEWVGTELARSFTRPLLHKPMFTDDLAFGNFLLFARYLRGVRTYPLLDDGTIVPDEWMAAVKGVSDPLTVAIEWQKGDILMLDNSRFMHGRTAVEPGSKRLIATYFGYLAGAIPDAEEPLGPVWRKPGFCPPGTGLSPT
jgi:alpha-ketoglutarate-dependent taurine dioxygenase